MTMSKALDLILISGEKLKDVNLFTKMDVYAVVSLSNAPNTQLKTPVDNGCGKNPSWNHHVQLHVPTGEAPTAILRVVILAVNNIGADRVVGRVDVSVEELEEAAAAGSGFKVKTFDVRTPSGKLKGTLKFSYKFGEPVQAVPLSASGYPPSQAGYGYGYGYGTYPPQGQQQQQPDRLGMLARSFVLVGMLIVDVIGDVAAYI